MKKLRVEIATLQKSEPKDNAPSAETEAVKRITQSHIASER